MNTSSAGTPAAFLATAYPPGGPWAGVYGSDGPKAIDPGKCPAGLGGSPEPANGPPDCHIGG